jgi:hypothetical protein
LNPTIFGAALLMFCDNYPCGHASSDIKQRNLKWFRTLSGLVLGFLLFGSSLRWGNVYIESAGYKPLNSRGRPSVVAQPFSRVGPYRILVRPHVGALMAASLAGEPRFDIGQPDTGHRSALIAVEWLQRDNQRSRSAHRARAGTSWARAMVPGPEFSLFSRCLNHQWGHRVFPTSRQCSSARVATTQNSGGTKPFSFFAKTFGNGRWVSIDHRRRATKAR